MKENTVLLYDIKRDGEIKPGEVLLVFEDGKTKRVHENTLYRREDKNNERTVKIQRPGAFRSRAAREVKHRAAKPRQVKKGKRLPVYKA